MRKYFEDWTLFEKLWLLIATVVVLGASFYWKDSLMGITCSLTGMWCVVLTAKKRVANYIVGTVNVALYAYIAYQSTFYGEAILNAFYFLPLQFVGFIAWKKHKIPDTIDTVYRKPLALPQWLLVVAGLFFSTGLMTIFLDKIGAEQSLWGAISFAFSIVAMIMMINRLAEQWILWIIVDVATVVMWAIQFFNGGNDVAVLIMWIAYLINAIYGWLAWKNAAVEE